MYVGWVAHKNSFADGMPLKNEPGDVVLTFSGEDYADPELVGRLRQRGHSVSESKASYLAHVYEEDSSFPCSLSGMFHGLLADRTRGTVTLFNDRYGMHRICYHESEEGFYFAAEAKAILAARPELRTPSLKGLGEFVACSCVLENRTIFKDIHVLPAASAWVFRDRALEQRRVYFEPSQWEQQAPLESEPYYQGLLSVLSRRLPNYFAGPEQVAVALTGGMDTRVIMALYHAAAGAVPCYTFGGMFRECEDVPARTEGRHHLPADPPGDYSWR